MSLRSLNRLTRPKITTSISSRRIPAARFDILQNTRAKLQRNLSGMATAAVETPSVGPFSITNSAVQYHFPAINQMGAKATVHDVKTVLNYFQDSEDGSPPEPTYLDKPETHDRPFVVQDVTIHDISGQETQYTLDSHGFQVLKHTSQERDFSDADRITAEYYPETERLLKDVTGASRIVIFDHTIRRAGGDPHGTPSTAIAAKAGKRGPVYRVHIDQSYAAVPKRVRRYLGDEADVYLRGRYQLINVWRPIKTITRDPLAVADAHSVAETDLVPIGLVYSKKQGEAAYAGETLSVRPNEKHKWYYKHGLRPDEVLLLKCFDSKTDGRARRVPHTSFIDPSTKHILEERESIEIRALVFHPEDTN